MLASKEGMWGCLGLRLPNIHCWTIDTLRCCVTQMMISAPYLSREMAPPSHQTWARVQTDARTVLETRLAAWLQSLAELEVLFSQHVYDNPNMGDFDLRQHRQYLYWALADGESIAVEHIKAKSAPESVAFIDQRLEQLRTTLNQWHGTIESQIGFPESLKQGFQDSASERVVDMETALQETPPQ